jgi:hypothetical protein
LAAVAYFFITNFGITDSRNLTSIFLLSIEMLELARKPFFKLGVSGDSINFKSINKHANFTFDEITKVEITKVFGIVFVDVFSNDDKIFTLNNQMFGFSLFIERLKKEHIEWRSSLGTPLDKSDI